MATLSHLNPQLLWQHFETICSIPHPSKHEEKLINHIVATGKRLGLETLKDKRGNILIKKPATHGFENRKTVILQAHIDMVPQKNNGTKHNFTTDSIKPQIDGDWVKATNTTLGADNGIGAASILAILESTAISHGPIEALFTVDEEAGMGGAFALDTHFLSGDILLNTDSEDETELIVGCAGGIDLTACFTPMHKTIDDSFEAFTIYIKGLKGGHSGIDIALARGNANVLMARLLAKLIKKFDTYVARFDGGNMRNAIPRESQALVCVKKEITIEFLVFVKKFFKSYEVELKGIDDSLKISCKATPLPTKVYEQNFCYEFLKAVTCCPNGVIKMEPGLENIVQTSTNLSIIESSEEEINVHCLLRSSSEDEKKRLTATMASLFELFGAKISTYGNYPGWKPSAHSDILGLFKTIFPKIIGTNPDIKVIHAGLECGIIGSKFPNLDMISFGPTIKHPHSPDEKVQVSSVAKYWQLLVEILQNIPSK